MLKKKIELELERYGFGMLKSTWLDDINTIYCMNKNEILQVTINEELRGVDNHYCVVGYMGYFIHTSDVFDYFDIVMRAKGWKYNGDIIGFRKLYRKERIKYLINK